MYDFISLIIIVFGILQIILFFKIWGATNDIKKLKNKLATPVKGYDKAVVSTLSVYLSSGKEEALKHLNELMAKKVISEYYKAIESGYNYKNVFAESWQNTLKLMAPIYNELGAQVPERFTSITFDSVRIWGEEK